MISQKKNPLSLSKSNGYFSSKRAMHTDLGKRKKKKKKLAKSQEQ